MFPQASFSYVLIPSELQEFQSCAYVLGCVDPVELVGQRVLVVAGMLIPFLQDLVPAFEVKAHHVLCAHTPPQKEPC